MCKILGDRVHVAVRDTGAGISEEVTDQVARNEMPGNKIGLLNVHHRVTLLSGQGLTTTCHHSGTEIGFTLSKTGQRLPASPCQRNNRMKAIIVEDEFLARQELSYCEANGTLPFAIPFTVHAPAFDANARQPPTAPADRE